MFELFPVHPITVHLPIGLLIGNMLLTVFVLRSQDATNAQSLDGAAYQCLRLGTLFLLPAIAAGIIDTTRYWFSAARQEHVLIWLNMHALLGFILLIVYWQAWQLRRHNPGILLQSEARTAYILRLGIGCILLLISGWIGGHMVYAFGVGLR